MALLELLQKKKLKAGVVSDVDAQKDEQKKKWKEEEQQLSKQLPNTEDPSPPLPPSTKESVKSEETKPPSLESRNIPLKKQTSKSSDKESDKEADSKGDEENGDRSESGEERDSKKKTENDKKKADKKNK